MSIKLTLLEVEDKLRRKYVR